MVVYHLTTVSDSESHIEVRTKGSTLQLDLHPVRLTWNLRIHPWKRKIMFQTIIFRFWIVVVGSFNPFDIYIYINKLLVGGFQVLC